MEKNRAYVLSIAGYDPCGGAGVLADVKTFEGCSIYGMAVNTCQTIQNENKIDKVYWNSLPQIKDQVKVLSCYKIKAIKIGLIKDLNMLNYIIRLIKQYFPDSFVLWDPIVSSSSDFNFHPSFDNKLVLDILPQLSLITPNLNEILFFKMMELDNDPDTIARKISKYCPVFLKGGHQTQNKMAIDKLFCNKDYYEFSSEMIPGNMKHGTGCILSSAIIANIALGNSLSDSCINAKKYVSNFIRSNILKLGYHVSEHNN